MIIEKKRDMLEFVAKADRAKSALLRRNKTRGHYTCPCCGGRVNIALEPIKYHARVHCTACNISIVE